MTDRILVTSALPYVNGIKHLGNLAGSLLPADAYARFQRQLGRDVLFVCATDEHGTPAELSAREARLPVAEYCARLHAAQADVYRRFGISFDHFGRSSCAANHALTRHLARRLEENGYIEEREVEQVWSPDDGRFLPDRYVTGTCPRCGDPGARGDQCEACGATLDPTDLVRPRSALSGSERLETRRTRHLFLRQSALAGRLREWVDGQRQWPALVRSIALGWLEEGLRDRCITRDLEWGIPVDRPGFEGKVFYVWFDAPIEYVAAVQEWASLAPGRDWRDWWDTDTPCRYVQFLAKDNVPFHTLSFPATLIGSGERIRLPDQIKGFHWLTYEGGKFSTSARRGVFADQALEELPADAWRWWLLSNAPEGGDVDFSFARFAEDVNKDLADVTGNLVRRVATLCLRAGPGADVVSPPEDAERRLSADVDACAAEVRAALEATEFRKGAAAVRKAWVLGNRYVAETEPWRLLREDRDHAARVLRTAVSAVRHAAALSWPFIPETAERVLGCTEGSAAVPPFPREGDVLRLDTAQGEPLVDDPGILFEKVAPSRVADLAKRFAGSPCPASG